MTRIFPALLLLTITFTGFGQTSKPIDSLSIKFVFPFTQIYDSSQLTLKVGYKNNINRDVSIYKQLIEGGTGNVFTNFRIDLEKLEEGKYRHQFTGCNMGRGFLWEDSLRHYDPPKKKLAPYSSDTLELNILTIVGGFQPGKYRFRAHVRTKTIRDDRVYTDSTFSTLPPEDEIVYTSSQWIYFTIKKEIYRRMNRSEN